MESGPKSKISKNDLGFTLFELLVVITIVAILASIVTFRLTAYLQRGRDHARKQELSQIQQALTLYYNDFSNYPCADGAYFVGSLAGCGLGTTYMKEIPHDKTASANGCSSQSSDYSYVISGSRQNYKLYAKLENTNDSAVSGSYNVNIGGTGCNYNYRIENP